MDEQRLLHRLETLERQNRRQRHGLLALALAAGAVLWMAQAPVFPPELRAHRMVLIDEQGDVRLELRATEGAPSITVRDGDGVLVQLTGDRGRGAVRYRNAKGAVRDLAAPPGPRPVTRN